MPRRREGPWEVVGECPYLLGVELRRRTLSCVPVIVFTPILDGCLDSALIVLDIGPSCSRLRRALLR
ncbi:hypothetical protein JYU34_021591 [Plutella xylostella]|uniref:Uncharacterized protein n=1 Tax=Plutella xylostella TaxID=51655 RepID=A0ABQ7PUI0_PLUXY|nr:hypothetical protein JYU34_021591 [Plutella xylostella]